jgi:AraC family transcriptional regulator
MALTPMIGHGELHVTSEAPPETPNVRSWLGGAVVFDHRRWTCAQAELTWTAPCHLVVLTHAGRTARTRISCAGELIHDGRDRPGALSFIPAGVERSGSYSEVDLVYSALWLDPDRFDHGSCTDGLPTLVNRSDPVIAALLTSLQREIAGDAVPDAGYVEHLVAVLMHRILLLGGGRRTGTGRATIGSALGKATLRRVHDHMEQHLDGEIRLGDLAAIAGMEVDSFARRYRAATGMAPYAAVIEHRVRRAEQLLDDAELELGVIAARLGFSSQSHFTTTFKRQRGMTPNAYRRQLLS